MSASRLVWYHVKTHEWRDAPPKDGTWAMPYIQGRSPFSGLPHHTAIIDKLEQERSKLERDFREVEEDRDRLKSLHFSAALRIADLERNLTTLRSLASAMVEEMEQHGGDQAFDSLAWYRAALGKEAKP